MNHKISVIIRTYKREKLLKELIEKILNKGDGPEEIIVVDNDINGSAENVVESFANDYPVKYFIQPEISASKTANLGIEKSKGEIVAFIDDDAIPEKNWIREIRKVFKNEKIHIVGGKVKLKTDKTLPAWIDYKLKSFLGEIDLGGKFRKMRKNEFPVLMNFAAKKEVFEKVGKFSEKLGYQKNKPFAGEETAFCISARKKGYEIYYNPDIVVYHRVNPERVKRKYFLKKKFWEGRALFVMNRMFYPLLWEIMVFVFRIFMVVPAYTLILFFCLLFLKKESVTVYFLCKIMRNLGYGFQVLSIY